MPLLRAQPAAPLVPRTCFSIQARRLLRQLCSDRTMRGHGLHSAMSSAATARALPTCRGERQPVKSSRRTQPQQPQSSFQTPAGSPPGRVLPRVLGVCVGQGGCPWPRGPAAHHCHSWLCGEPRCSQPGQAVLRGLHLPHGGREAQRGGDGGLVVQVGRTTPRGARRYLLEELHSVLGGEGGGWRGAGAPVVVAGHRDAVHRAPRVVVALQRVAVEQRGARLSPCLPEGSRAAGASQQWVQARHTPHTRAPRPCPAPWHQAISEQSPRSEGSGCSPTRCSQQGQPKRCLAGVKQPPAGSLQLSWGLQPLLVSSH